jgi:hypothetical protein
MEEAEARKASKAKTNRKYYLANKATLAASRHIRYIEKEKPNSARKQFLEILSESCDPLP